MYNSLGMCDFVGAPIGPWNLDKIAEYVNAVTGWDTSLFDLMKVGERANVHAAPLQPARGLHAADDTLPERLFAPLEGGTLKGHQVDRQEFAAALRTYYQMAGWDPTTGVPTQAKLEELDIAWAGELIK